MIYLLAHTNDGLVTHVSGVNLVPRSSLLHVPDDALLWYVTHHHETRVDDFALLYRQHLKECIPEDLVCGNTPNIIRRLPRRCVGCTCLLQCYEVTRLARHIVYA
jgi:hypothetical protein